MGMLEVKRGKHYGERLPVICEGWGRIRVRDSVK